MVPDGGRDVIAELVEPSERREDDLGLRAQVRRQEIREVRELEPRLVEVLGAKRVEPCEPRLDLTVLASQHFEDRRLARHVPTHQVIGQQTPDHGEGGTGTYVVDARHVRCSAGEAMTHSPSIRNRLIGVNVPPVERIVSGLAGGAAILAGVSRRSRGGAALTATGVAAVVRAISGRCPAYRARAIRKGIQVRRTITIQATPREVYDFWRDLENLPAFMHHVEAVTVDASGLSTWTVDEGGKKLEWLAQIVEDSPGQRLRWESIPGGDIDHSGSIEVRAAPGDRGCELEVKLHYLPPGGLIVASTLYTFLRKLVGVQIGKELVRLRQLIETGEIATGARRVDDIEDEDKGALVATTLRPQPLPPVTRAETSRWNGNGGSR